MEKTEYSHEELGSAREDRRQELERTYSHEGYSVIRKELFPHLRDPAMTIRNGTITFNTACINGLEDVVYVKFEINEELKRLAIKPCDENDRNAVRWCVAKPDKRKTRYIKCPDVTDKIFELMEWNKAYRYKILAYMIAPEGVDFYIFDLLIWERTKIGSRRKIEDGPETSDAMEPIEGSETQTKNENASTDEQKLPASKPPIEERFSSEVAGSFGESVDQLQRDTEVKEIDGFVTMDLITGSRQPRE